MPWSGSPGAQVFSRTDGTRSGTQVWTNADAAGVDIVTTDHDTHDQDLADGISSCIKADGGNTATSHLPMGGFGHTNVAQATSRTMYARASDVQDNRLSYCTVGGTANAIVLTNALTVSGYTKGQVFQFLASYSNTGAVTIAVDGLAAKAVNVAGVALSAGQIIAGAWVTVAFDGTDFEMAVGTTPAVIGVGCIMAWPMPTVPTGWLECDGSAVSRSTYSSLFSAIGTSYGPGNGTTTFNLPNYKNQFLRGFDASGTDAASRTDRGDGTTGASVGTKQADEHKSHTHTFTGDSVADHTHVIANTDTGTRSNLSSSNTIPYRATYGDGTFNYLLEGTTTPATIGKTSASGGHTPTGTNAAAGGTETRPKNITVKWIILAQASASLSTAQIAPWFTALIGDATGLDSSSEQPVFGSTEDEITLPASTSYHFKALYYVTRAAGSTSHTTSVLFGGTATFTSIMYTIESTTTTGAPSSTTNSQQLVATAATATVAATASTSTTENIVIKLEGIMRINASGTVIPQIKYSAAPGGAPTFKANSYFMLTPLGSDTVSNVGPWG